MEINSYSDVCINIHISYILHDSLRLFATVTNCPNPSCKLWGRLFGDFKMLKHRNARDSGDHLVYAIRWNGNAQGKSMMLLWLSKISFKHNIFFFETLIFLSHSYPCSVLLYIWTLQNHWYKSMKLLCNANASFEMT